MRHSPHRFEIPQSGIMAVRVKRTSKAQQQWLHRKVSKADLEALCFTGENAQNTGILWDESARRRILRFYTENCGS